VPIGTQFVACVGDTACGYVKWIDKKRVDERIGRVADGFIMPLRESLGDTDKSLWEQDAVGQPRDPWFPQWFLPMAAVEDGNRVVFASGSGGGKKAVGRLLRAYADNPLRGNPISPGRTHAVGRRAGRSRVWSPLSSPLSPPSCASFRTLGDLAWCTPPAVAHGRAFAPTFF
jgi:hypothetical protein